MERGKILYLIKENKTVLYIIQKNILYILYILYKKKFKFYLIHYVCKISNKNDQFVTLTTLVIVVLK